MDCFRQHLLPLHSSAFAFNQQSDLSSGAGSSSSRQKPRQPDHRGCMQQSYSGRPIFDRLHPSAERWSGLRSAARSARPGSDSPAADAIPSSPRSEPPPLPSGRRRTSQLSCQACPRSSEPSGVSRPAEHRENRGNRPTTGHPPCPPGPAHPERFTTHQLASRPPEARQWSTLRQMSRNGPQPVLLRRVPAIPPGTDLGDGGAKRRTFSFLDSVPKHRPGQKRSPSVSTELQSLGLFPYAVP